MWPPTGVFLNTRSRCSFFHQPQRGIGRAREELGATAGVGLDSAHVSLRIVEKTQMEDHMNNLVLGLVLLGGEKLVTGLVRGAPVKKLAVPEHKKQLSHFWAPKKLVRGGAPPPKNA